MDLGDPISYLVLAEGVPVYSSDEQPVGTLARIFAAPDEDIFDGLVIATDDGERYVGGDQAGRLYERGIVLPFDADAARRLPPAPLP